MDSREGQTVTASPAEPGELPFGLVVTNDDTYLGDTNSLSLRAPPNLQGTKHQGPGLQGSSQQS
jgi:hypothetical protein